MKMLRLGLVLLMVLCSYAATIYAGTPNNMVPSLAPMLQKVLPAVVNVRTIVSVPRYGILMNRARQNRKGNNDFDNDVPLRAIANGSGVIINAVKGYIITNAHVVDHALSVRITLGDGRHYPAKIIGMDKPSDIALLQIQAKNLIALTMADSNQVKVGDFVAAIGNPFGLSQTVTSGIVSALGRSTLGIENYENFIQTDASINPGNSGGALINLQGELVGINTAILSPDHANIGISFAIPSSMAKSVIMQLIRYGNVRRGILGVLTQDITPELAKVFQMTDTKGAVIAQVLANSPAASSGLQVNDIITRINDFPIKNANDVIMTIGFLRVNSSVDIQVLRNHKVMSFSAKLLDPKQQRKAAIAKDPFFYGVAMKDTREVVPAFGLTQGILVLDVAEESNAWQDGLRPGDVIVSANQQKVTTMEELNAVVAEVKHDLLLNVRRGSQALFIVISADR